MPAIAPARKIRAIANDASPLSVKQLLIMSLPSLPAPGRNRTSPVARPNSGKMAINPEAEMMADPTP